MVREWLRNNIDSVLISAIGFAIVLIYTHHSGIGISPDSVAYISTARNLISGNGFTDYTGSPLVIFPLFYPLFLSVVMFVTRTDIVTLAPYLNASMFAAVIIISGAIINRFKYKTAIYKRIILLIIAVCPSLLEIYTMLWSETLFILLILVFIIFLRRYFTSHSIRSLIIAAVTAAIAFDTRFAGITLAATGIMLMFFDKKLPWKMKLTHGSIFGSISFSLAVANIIRNMAEKGLATGMRQKGVTPLEKNIEFSGNVISDWLTIHTSGHLFFVFIAVAVLLLFTFYFIRNIRHWKAYYTNENISVAFFIVYVLFIILSSTISRYEPINNRLLSPAFLPLLLISTCQLPKWRTYMPYRKLQWIFLAFSVGIGIFLIGSYVTINRVQYSDMEDDGIPGFTEDPWMNSPIVGYLKHHPEFFDTETDIYSNHNYAVYFLTGASVDAIPERVYKQDVNDFRESDPIILIWFYLDPNPDILSIGEIKKLKHARRMKSFTDGAIYYLSNN